MADAKTDVQVEPNVTPTAIAPAAAVAPVDDQDATGGNGETFSREYVQSLREEAKASRKEAEALKKAAAVADKERQVAADKAAAEQGQYKSLYEAAQARIAALEPLESKWADMLADTAAANEKRVAALPDTVRGFVPDYGDDPLKLRDWLDANAAAVAALSPSNGTTPANGRVAATTPTPAAQGTQGLTQDERRARAARTF